MSKLLDKIVQAITYLRHRRVHPTDQHSADVIQVNEADPNSRVDQRGTQSPSCNTQEVIDHIDERIKNLKGRGRFVLSAWWMYRN